MVTRQSPHQDHNLKKKTELIDISQWTNFNFYAAEAKINKFMYFIMLTLAKSTLLYRTHCNICVSVCYVSSVAAYAL